MKAKPFNPQKFLFSVSIVLAQTICINISRQPNGLFTSLMSKISPKFMETRRPFQLKNRFYFN